MLSPISLRRKLGLNLRLTETQTPQMRRMRLTETG